MTKEIGYKPWGTPTKDWDKPLKDQIASSFRSIEAKTEKEARAFMEKHYAGIQKMECFSIYKVWFEKCHYKRKENGKNIFSYMTKRQYVESTK